MQKHANRGGGGGWVNVNVHTTCFNLVPNSYATCTYYQNYNFSISFIKIPVLLCSLGESPINIRIYIKISKSKISMFL